MKSTRVLLAALAVMLLGLTTALAQQKPNILVIFGDDVGIMNLSAYHRGMMGGSTPNSTASPMRVCCSPIIEWLCATLSRHPKEYFHDQSTSHNISRSVLPRSGAGVGSREAQGPAVSVCHNSANSGGFYRIWCNGRRNAEVRRQVLSHNGRRFGRRWLWRFAPDSIGDCVWSGAPGRFRRCLSSGSHRMGVGRSGKRDALAS